MESLLAGYECYGEYYSLEGAFKVGQTRKSSRGKIGVKKKGWDKRTCLQAEKVTGRFANVPFTNILSRSAKK